MLLSHATWPEVVDYLTHAAGLIVPIGSTEQHGPSGLIGTDAICAEAIAKGVGQVTGAYVGPTINIGMAQHHMAFAGTLTYRPSTLIAVIKDYVLSLAEHGFRRIYFINGHGGNVPSIRAAFYEIYAELRESRGEDAPDLRCAMISWFEGEGVAPLARQLFGEAEGRHATPSEVSVTQYVYPEQIRDVPLDPEIAPAGAYFDARDFRRRHPDGRIGSNPMLASPKHGERLYETAVAALAKSYQKFVDSE